MKRDLFDAAVREHSRKAFSLAVYLLGDRGEAEDVTQEALIRLWRKGDEVDPERIGPWLLRVTRNACIDVLRRQTSRVTSLTPKPGERSYEPEVNDPCPERLARASQLGENITAALRRLSEPQRSIVVLREVHGLPYQQIAEVLRIPLATVRVALHRGRAKLRKDLKKEVDHAAVC